MTFYSNKMLFLFTGTRARILVASAWIFSVIFSIPSLVLFEDTPSPNDESIRFCYLDLSEKWHWMVSYLLFFFLTSVDLHFLILLYMITFFYLLHGFFIFQPCFLVIYVSLVFSFLSLLFFFPCNLSFLICNLFCFFSMTFFLSTFPCSVSVFLYSESFSLFFSFFLVVFPFSLCYFPYNYCLFVSC